MPHDSNNQLLKVGDEVMIRGKITNLCEGEEFCNCTVELTLPMRGSDGKSPTTFSVINTGQLELVPVNDSE